MSIFRDKQIKYFGVFLLVYSLLLFLFGIGLHTVQNRAIKNLFLSNNKAIVTSLLEQGVSKDVIATAVTNTVSNEQGKELLDSIGITEYTVMRDLPAADFRQISAGFLLTAGIFMCTLLFGGTLIFLWKREQLYCQATNVIERFTTGDFSCHMPQMNEGTIYRLFASADQLAMILQSKNEAAQRAKEFLKNTISDISHQLKTPLAALTLYHEIISAEPDHAAVVKEYSEKTGMALNRMQQLIQAMLKITRLDAGNIVFEKESCPISALISQAIRELTMRALEEGKEIRIDKSPKEIIICDKQWTSEAIENIVKNALDHTATGGKIRISWNRTPTMVHIVISDNGTGILPEDLHHIFKRFYRSKKSLGTQGTGLGLSLAKSIVEGQGGMISVQSILQEGTVFTLSFLTEM